MRRMKSFLIMSIFLMGTLSFAFMYDKLWHFNFGKQNYTLKVEVENSSNLTIGTPVLMNGVRIGKVEDIYLEKSVVVIILSISNTIMVPRGSEVKISYKGMIGDLVVNIFRAAEQGEYYQDGDIINGEGPTSTNEILEKMTKITGQLDIILEDVVKAGTGSLMENIETFTENLSNMQVELEGVVKSFREDSQPKLNNIVSNVEEGAVKFEKIASRLDEIVDGNELEKSIKNIEFVTGRLSEIMDFKVNLYPEIKVKYANKLIYDMAVAVKIGPVYAKKEGLKDAKSNFTLKFIKQIGHFDVAMGVLYNNIGGSMNYSFNEHLGAGAEFYYDDKPNINLHAKIFFKSFRVKVKYMAQKRRFVFGAGLTL